MLDNTIKAKLLPPCIHGLREEILRIDRAGDAADGRKPDGILSEEDFERARDLIPELSRFETFGAFVGHVNRYVDDAWCAESMSLEEIVEGSDPEWSPNSAGETKTRKKRVGSVEASEAQDDNLYIDDASDILSQLSNAVIAEGGRLIGFGSDGMPIFRYYYVNFTVTKSGALKFLPDRFKDFLKRLDLKGGKEEVPIPNAAQPPPAFTISISIDFDLQERQIANGLKLKVIHITEPFLDRIAELHNESVLESPESYRGIELSLMALMNRPTISIAEKRERIFDLWDECNASRVGTRAQGRIVGFIEEILPEHSPYAYTLEEVQRFNGRRASGEAFLPYL